MAYENDWELMHRMSHLHVADERQELPSSSLSPEPERSRCAPTETLEYAMTQFVQRQHARRAPRANVRGSIGAVIRLENGRQFPAKLQQLSITGGLLDFATYMEERTWVELTIYLSSGAVRATAEMMFPMLGATSYLQPFRFTSLGGEELHAIDREVTGLLQQSVTPTERDSGVRAPRYYLETW